MPGGANNLHPAWTYMLRDTGGSLWATLVFSLALLAPGYVIAYLTDLCAFRSRGLPEQIAWSIALSFGVGTIAVVAAVWLGGATGGAVSLIAFGTSATVMMLRVRPFKPKDWRVAAPYVALGLSLWAVATASLIDVGLGSRLHMSVTAYDNALRTTFVNSVLRTGVPPANPVYWPGHDAPMRYYYFWYVVCAAVAKLGHTSARQALIASSTWSIFGVISSIALFGRYVMDWRGDLLRRRWWIATSLLAVTGFDGLIALLIYLGSRIVARDIEWWSLDQVSSWADTFLWVPHHAAALVCCALCFLMLWVSVEEKNPRLHNLTPAIAGVAFASAFGLSTYVAIGAALVLAMWMAARFFDAGELRAIRAYGIAVTIAAICLTPYLLQLLKPQPGVRVSAGSILRFEIRELLTPVVLADVPGIRSLAQTHPHMAREVSAGLLLVPSYFLELGFFAVALAALQRKPAKTRGERAVLFLTWTGLLSVSFLRSRVITMNDYSVRASLIPQFMLLVAGVLAIDRWRGLTRILLVSFLVIGAAGSTYQVLLLRTYLPIHEAEGVEEYAGLAHQNYALRDAYAEMQGKVSINARVQFSVPNSGYSGFAQQMNVNRQIVVDGEHCNDSFGGENEPCAAIQASIATLFSGARAVPADEAIQLCKKIGADYLVAARWNPVWNQKQGWAWTLPLVVVRPDVRIVACGLHD